MPRKVIAKHSGCIVRSKYLKADGTRAEGLITITPERPSIYNGAFYDNKPIAVQVSINGEFEIVLPPSSILGKYQINIAGRTFMFEVPDNRSDASLAELISE